MSPSERNQLVLTKHEGAGNDFLVICDPANEVVLDDVLVRALCDRHRGIGADGVIRVGPASQGAELTMELRNADGGEAEMSGNGMRCLAQAAVDAGLVTGSQFAVATLGGVRQVEYRPSEQPGRAWANVEMGLVTLGEDQPQRFEDRRARQVDVGNPHLVLLGPHPSEIEVDVIGPRIESVHPGGVNVEFIALGEKDDELILRVWERGVGETLACGTGSVAAAAAARSWGVVGNSVVVHNPGGPLEVKLGNEPDDVAYLAGPVRKVAELRVDVATIL